MGKANGVATPEKVPTNGKGRHPPKAGSPSILLRIVAILVAVLAVLVGTLFTYKPAPVPWVRTASYVTLADGRNLTYLIREEPAPHHRHTLIYVHGLSSCRLENMILDEAVLRELGIWVIALDRPGWGQSDPHPQRTYESFADDVRQLADALHLQKFFLMGTSAGGAYAWAAAAAMPDRIQALLVISASGSAAELASSELEELHATAIKWPTKRLMSMFGTKNPLAAAVKAVAQTPLGARLVYQKVLRVLVDEPYKHLDSGDSQCFKEQHPEYPGTLFPEALVQGSGAAWVEDALLLLQPWSTNLSALPADLLPRVHVLHSAHDETVPAVFTKSLLRRLPGANVEIVEAPGHIAWWYCNPDLQRRILAKVLASGCHDTHPECARWAGEGECRRNLEFMLTGCGASCGSCHLSAAGAQAEVAACVDTHEQCEEWAAANECALNPEYMLMGCRKSCAQCWRQLAAVTPPADTQTAPAQLAEQAAQEVAQPSEAMQEAPASELDQQLEGVAAAADET